MFPNCLPKVVAGIVFAISVFMIPKIASADCLTDNLNGLPANFGRRFNMTIALDGGSWVSWSNGTTNNAGTASINMAQYFSDRVNGSQPFDANAVDWHEMTSINSSTGAVAVHNNSWNFNWSFTLTCVSGLNDLATATLSNGVVIVSFGDVVGLGP